MTDPIKPVNRTDVGGTEGGVPKHRLAEVCPVKVCPVEMYPAEIRPLEIRPPEVRPAEIRLLEVCSTEIHPLEVGTAEVSPLEVGSLKVGFPEGECDRRIPRSPVIPLGHAAAEEIEVLLVGHG